MPHEINNVQLHFQCTQDISAMRDVEGGKYCTHCEKTVYDFTNSNSDAFRKILADNNHNICGKFRRDQLVQPTETVKPLWKKWVSAAMILLGINLLQQKAFAQTPQSDTLKTKQSNSVEQNSNEVFGGVGYQPEYPGGLEKFYALIKKHLKDIEGASGKKAIVTFMVEKDGSLSDIKALRGPNEAAKAEAVRVVKLTSKWKPGTQDNKPVRIQFTMPITFK